MPLTATASRSAEMIARARQVNLRHVQAQPAAKRSSLDAALHDEQFVLLQQIAVRVDELFASSHRLDDLGLRSSILKGIITR